ncbi:MAG: hypothetical protein H6739_40760 [Alphaproteobacteria bacterium]|nr:hypothetical protein [Alphaproteobacteria bacterium]
MRAALLLSLALPGCALFSSGQPEGNWLVTITQTSYVCDGEDIDIPTEPWQMIITSYRAADGAYVMNVDGVLLTGTGDGDGFNVSYRDTVRYSDPECAEQTETGSLTLRGRWGDDTSFSGQAISEYNEAMSDCYGITDETGCTDTYEATGVLLSSTSKDHVVEGVGGRSLIGSLPGASGGGGYP